MTPQVKLLVHLEMIVFDDLPEGTMLNAREVSALIRTSTPDQRRRAYERSLVQIPFLLPDEQSEDFKEKWISTPSPSSS